MVTLAQTTPSRRPPLPLPAAAAHDRGAVREREHGLQRSPLHSPKPTLNRENVKVLLEYYALCLRVFVVSGVQTWLPPGEKGMDPTSPCSE